MTGREWSRLCKGGDSDAEACGVPEARVARPEARDNKTSAADISMSSSFPSKPDAAGLASCTASSSTLRSESASASESEASSADSSGPLSEAASEAGAQAGGKCVSCPRLNMHSNWEAARSVSSTAPRWSCAPNVA